MKKTSDLYFIALIPPEPIFSEVYNYKLDIQKNYNSKAALKSPPHITLHMPFQMTEKKAILLGQELDLFVQKFTPFIIDLQNFGHFGERVIYIDIADSNSLNDLQFAVNKFMKLNFNLFNSTHKDNGFNPHMTIAFRDLKKEQFRNAWNVYKNENYSRQFEANGINLLKHNGAKWEVHKNYTFKNSIG